MFYFQSFSFSLYLVLTILHKCSFFSMFLKSDLGKNSFPLPPTRNLWTKLLLLYSDIFNSKLFWVEQNLSQNCFSRALNILLLALHSLSLSLWQIHSHVHCELNWQLLFQARSNSILSFPRLILTFFLSSCFYRLKKSCWNDFFRFMKRLFFSLSFSVHFPSRREKCTGSVERQKGWTDEFP